MRRGYLLFEIIIVVAILASMGIYSLSRKQVSFVMQKTAAYEFQDAMQYGRSLVKNKEITKAYFEFEKLEGGGYSYTLSDEITKKKFYHKELKGDFGIFDSVDESTYFPLKKAEYSFGLKSANEKSKHMTIYFGDAKGKKMSFKLTIVPTTGRVHIYEEP
ncbi:pilus assembly FimT family protein [Filifactor villosus]|uniref:Tfp pilus assembly protein FimT/FimU n=1 Tax=Filifactor villosus TaxID=29374 RepID=A0ABV9QNG4_9FIRM